jgi:hypothetical protein
MRRTNDRVKAIAGQRAGAAAFAAASAARYNGRVLYETDPQSWALKALREAGGSLMAELHGLDERELRWRPAEGEWSLKEIAAHLRDAEELALAQVNAFVQTDARLGVSGRARRVPAWDVDLLPEERDYQGEDIGALLSSFRESRREVTSLLWTLSDADWERSAEHPFRGAVTLGEIARELAQHDLEHLWQVRQLKERLRESAEAEEDWP